MKIFLKELLYSLNKIRFKGGGIINLRILAKLIRNRKVTIPDGSGSEGQSGNFVPINKLDTYSLQIRIKTLVRNDTIIVYEIDEPNEFPMGFNTSGEIRLCPIYNINAISEVDGDDVRYNGVIACDSATLHQMFSVYLFKDFNLDKYYIASFEYTNYVTIIIPVRTDNLYEKI